MSATDEIMGAREHGGVTIDDIMTAVVNQYRVLGELITAAIAGAEKRGAEQMQQRIFPCCGGSDESPAEHTMDCEHTASRLAELDAAKREGAEQMRAAMNDKAQAQQPVAWIRYQSDGGIDGPLLDSQIDDVRRQCWTPLVAADWAVRAMPLPTGPRQAVRMSDERIGEISWDPAGCEHVNGLRLMDSPLQFARAIESAVLAANGLETK